MCYFCLSGLEKLIAQTEDEYVTKAVDLASDIPMLNTLRLGLRDGMLKSHLCNGPKFVRGLESTYRTLWHRYCNGDVPSELRRKAKGEVTDDWLQGNRCASNSVELTTDMSMKDALCA